MNFLSNFKIGQRLALGFAIVLGLSILTTVIGIVKMSTVADAAEDMLNEPVRKDRLINEWSGNIALAVQRTTAIVKSSDPSLAQVFAANAVETDKKAAEILKQIEPLLVAPDEKQAFAQMMEIRKDYKGGRQKAIALKEAGQLQESNEVLDKVYLPAAQVYQAGIARLVKMQRDRVDELSGQIQTIKQNSRRTVVLLSVLSTVFGVLCAWALGRSIVRPVREAVEVAQRVAAFIDDLRQAGTLEALLVCHAGTIRLLSHMQGAVAIEDAALKAAQTPHRIAYGELVVINTV